MDIKKVEVRGLETAICGLMHKLHQLITDENGHHPFYPGEGLRIHLPDPFPDNGQVAVRIQAIWWPANSFIKAVYTKRIDGWTLCDGGLIVTPHLESVCHGICFGPSRDGLGIKLVIPDDKMRTTITANMNILVRSLRSSLK